MEDTLRRLREHLPTDYEEFRKDWARQKLVERALQIMIEAMIDIGERVIALTGGAPAETSVAVLERLQVLGVIQDASRYAPMVRFRNFLVHQYEEVDLSIVYGIITKKLGDIEAFAAEVKAYAESH
ncbi:type VII toxin-antitoxin system HepT family RNase toxin [Candidatus Nitrospira bockiana]